jgi:7-cyano-7-deazaguanine reductase
MPIWLLLMLLDNHTARCMLILIPSPELLRTWKASAMQYLGHQSPMPADPNAFDLECVPNPEAQIRYAARFTIPEFTSLCPVTGQPDFATFVIDYIPRAKIVESKALKLYMTSFRNVGDFHEACTNKVAHKIWDAAMPWYLRVAAFWYPRGGIPIDVMIERGNRTIGGERVDVLHLDVRNFRGR